MHVRGVRGAITVESNTAEAIREATRTLLAEMVRANNVETDEIAAVIFTLTTDLNATFPAEGARQMGWTAVPLLSSTEIAVPGALERCLRVLMLVNTPRAQGEIVHIYMRGAEVLRPDIKPPLGGAVYGGDSCCSS
ncbi:MAG: chorismate mutase [bacterium]|nr:chorismate mutase [bacterium]